MSESIFDDVLETISQTAEQNVAHDEGDYEGPDGRLMCGVCHTPKQCVVNGKTVHCLCSHKAKERDERVAEAEREQSEMDAQKRRMSGISDGRLREIRLSDDDGRDQRITNLLNRYVELWDRNNNSGLCFYGTYGTGKTFYAAAVANALIDRGCRVVMTSFARIISDLWNEDDRSGYYDALSSCDMLIIDDLGTERQSEYAQEIVYTVIDGRYRSEKPVIITTNLDWEQIAHPDKSDAGRIYSRIVEMCIPVQVSGSDRRSELAEEKRRKFKEVLTRKQ